jgi:DNA-binding response OmpR family regulator
MTNLLSNAVKNSPTGGYIDISVLRQGDKVRVEVTDQGAGIPEAFQSCIFQKFAQADSSDNRQKGGTGLGLSICKAIIERYDGVIGFDTKEGVGTTFYFELPLMEMAAGQIDSRVAEGQGSHVLICEDDPDIAQLIDVLLQADGYVTDIAYCAAQAKAMLKSNNYAAMTLDLCLPDQDGISLIGDLRADEATRHLPIIVVSIKAEEGKKQLNGDAFGIIDWMVKPIDPDRLRDDLKRALQYSSGKKPRILHVEDDPDICKIITMIIGDEADVITATTLKDATSILKDGRFDLVILDLMLPDGSGEELLPLINRPGRPSTPVIVFSANQVTMETAKQVSAVLVKSRTTNQELANIIRAHTTPLNSLGSAP